MNKRLFSLVLAVCMMFMVSERTTVYASGIAVEEAEARSIKLQAQVIMNSLDKDALLVATLNDAVDESVPKTVREGATAEVEFIPVEGISEEDVEIEAHYTVQKVGEVLSRSGTSSNMYVASVVSAVREDHTSASESGVKAWAYITWIDNFGFDNELTKVEAIWNYDEDIVVDSRRVEYGIINALHLWTEDPIVEYPIEDDNEYEVSDMIGYKFKCHTSIYIVNIGTLNCTAMSTIAI